MTDTRCGIVDVIEDDDSTDELPILPGHLFCPEEDNLGDETVAAANQSPMNEALDSELRDANEKISSLSAELQSRSEAMLSMQRKLDDLQEFAKFLENEVASGKDVISHVTDELISVRSEQNDVGEQLRRREQEIAALRNKAPKKSPFSEQFARRVGTIGSADIDARDALGAPQAIGNGRAGPDRMPTLVARHGNAAMKYSIEPGGMSLGTGPENDVQLHDPLVSRCHATISNTPSGCVLKDLGSATGTWVNRRRVKMQVLHDGDAIVLGSTRFDFFEQGDRPRE